MLKPTPDSIKTSYVITKSALVAVALPQAVRLRRCQESEQQDKAEVGRDVLQSRWLRLREWFVTRWLDFEGSREDRQRQGRR